MKKLTTAVFLFALFVSLVLPARIFSQSSVDEADIKKNLPKMLGANNVGKEFWYTIPPCFEDESSGFPNFIKIFVTAPVKTLVTVEVPGKGFYNTKMTVANDVIEFNITPTVGQPYTKSGGQPNVAEQIWPGYGIHIFADQPIVVYTVVRYHWTSDGFLCIPVSSLGKEYITAGYKVDAMFRAVWNYKLPNTCGVTAAYNDTKVRWTLGGNAVTKTAGGQKPGDTKEWVLQKGDVLMYSTDADEADLSGSKIVASKPVSMVTGLQCANIPTGNQWCDYSVEMDIPTFTWGTDLHVAKIINRRYASLIRIFAKEPNTKIYRDNKQIGFIKYGGGVEGEAFLEMRMVPQDQKPRSVVISGDKPIGVTLYNCGTQEDASGGNSDPFFMAITPLQQYQKEITFCTPGVYGGTGFSENYVNLVYQADEFGMMNDSVMFAEVNSGQFVWSKLKSKFAGVDEAFADVQGKKFNVKVIKLPHDGVYKIKSDKPFAAYSFGYSDYDSYGYPTSAALADLEKPDTNAPQPKWIVQCNGNVDGAIVKDMPDDNTVRSNLAMINMDQANSFNYQFDYDPFIPGESRTTIWRLQVVDPSQDARAVITFADRRGNDTTIIVNYYAVKLSITPDKHDFGLLKVNSPNPTFDFVAKNESQNGPVLLKDLKLKFNNQNFTIDLLGKTLPLWLQPQETLPFKVTFSTATIGEFRDSIGIGDTCVFWYKSLVKAKVSEPMIDVSDINFGTISLGDQKSMEFTIKNDGTTPLTITGYVGPSLPIYTTNLPPTVNNKLSTPIVIEPRSYMKYTVIFKPTQVGTAFPDQIVFSSDADRTDSTCVIEGACTTPGFLANGYEWPKLRIDRPGTFPMGPYVCDAGKEAIVLSNNGSEAVIISDIHVQVVAGDESAFIYDKSKMINAKIDAGQSITVPVTFQPRKVGEHRIIISYDNSANRPQTSELGGFGILPKLETYNYSFGKTIIGDVANKKTKRIVFKNLNYAWEDTVVINDLIITPNGGISPVLGTYGTQGFAFDKAALGLPKLLHPGETLEFDADFVAQSLGNATANVKTSSGAEADVTSFWDGDGESQSITGVGTGAKICAGSSIVIIAKITNTGSPFQLKPLYFNPIAGDLKFETPTDWDHLVDVASGETKEIRMIYTPVSAYAAKNLKLMIPNTILGPDSLISLDIKLEAVHFDANTKISVQVPNLNRVWPQIGDAIATSISFARNGGSDISMAQVKQLDVTVNYNGAILKYITGSATIGGGFGGFAIKDIKVDDLKGEVKFTVFHPNGNIFNSDGELATLRFASFLPTNGDQYGAYKSTFTETTVGTGNLCISVTDAGDSATLAPPCGNNLRWIASSGVQYSLAPVNPNPISTNVANLDFSVGLDGQTEIAIFNTRGELVATPVSKVLQAGYYNIGLPISDLSSGVYYIKMKSGPYYETQELIIAK